MSRIRKRLTDASDPGAPGAGNDPDSAEAVWDVEFDSMAENEPAPDEDGYPAEEGQAREPIVLSRRAASYWALGVVFLMLWVFVLGILVGQGTLFRFKFFKEIEERLPVAREPAQPPKVEVAARSDPGQGGAETDNPKLTFYGNLAQTQTAPEPFRQKVDPPPVRPTPVATVEKTASPTVPPARETTPAADRTEPEARPEAVEAPPVKTVAPAVTRAAPPERRPGENFTVQVAATPLAEDAERIVRSLKAKGFEAYYYQVETKERRYFRVRVGRYQTREEAQVSHDQLKAAGLKNMFISRLVD